MIPFKNAFLGTLIFAGFNSISQTEITCVERQNAIELFFCQKGNKDLSSKTIIQTIVDEFRVNKIEFGVTSKRKKNRTTSNYYSSSFSEDFRHALADEHHVWGNAFEGSPTSIF